MSFLQPFQIYSLCFHSLLKINHAASLKPPNSMRVHQQGITKVVKIQVMRIALTLSSWVSLKLFGLEKIEETYRWTCVWTVMVQFPWHVLWELIRQAWNKSIYNRFSHYLCYISLQFSWGTISTSSSPLYAVFSIWKSLRVLQKACINIVARAIYTYLFLLLYILSSSAAK